MSGSDEQYERITQEFMSKMRAVRATVENYVAALRDARSEIDTAIDAARHDQGEE